MAADNDKLAFSTDWDIDQTFTEGEITIVAAAGSGYAGPGTGTPGRTSTSIAHGKSFKPRAKVRYQVSGGSYWHKPGASIFNQSTPLFNDLSGVQVAWMTDATNLTITVINGNNSGKTVTVRYRMLVDEI